ncbi:MAG: nucleotide-binding universal stress UspA family protein [Gammaproteobacteria bacterium]|jgi:nucleotide-binding universal stress UspA family protein
MSIKDILVQADNSDAFESRLHYSIALAQSHHAHLTALYTVPRYAIPAYTGISIDPAIFQTVIEGERQEAKKIQQKFETITANAELNVEWRLEEGDITHYLSLHGRYFDLVIVGQSNPDWGDDAFFGVADDLIIGLGRPGLVVPYVGAEPKAPKRILVAWNASRTATRAINDALPLLKNADFVEVMSINPEKNNASEGDIPAADISLHLARHGVKATAKESHTKDLSKGDLILSHAADIGADLLVMGAYGHSRFRELVLGGVTRQLLKQMTLPVFMSH